MAERVTRVESPADREVVDARQERVVNDTAVSGSTLASRIIWYIAGVIIVLLAFRFVLSLLGANPSNGFANFIYNVSHPFVAPFFGLFSYDQRLGVSRLEIYTLVAMAVYAILAWGLSKLVTIGKPRNAAV